MVQEAQSIVGMTASTVAVIAGLLALFDRWAQRRQRAGTPAVAPEAASPSGLIVVSHARVARRTPAPARRALVPSLGRVGRYLRLGLVVLAWFVCFGAGNDLVVVVIALLAEVSPAIERALAELVSEHPMRPVDAAGIVITTNFASLFVVAASGWRRRGGVVALLLGVAVSTILFLVAV